MTFVWIGAAAIFAWYVYQIAEQYISAGATPASTTKYEEFRS